MTCFAINACSGFAKGTLMVLFMVAIVDQYGGPQLQSARAFDIELIGADGGAKWAWFVGPDSAFR
jgi:hypothetical protein